MAWDMVFEVPRATIPQIATAIVLVVSCALGSASFLLAHKVTAVPLSSLGIYIQRLFSPVGFLPWT
jgi:hypothetical protein